MSRISVRLTGEDGFWDIVVSRSKEPRPLTPVWLSRGAGTKNRLLCQVQGDDRFGWSVVVAGDVDGHRLARGFKTRWLAIQYAVQIRVDINREKEE